MILIVFHHYAVHSGFYTVGMPMSLNKVWLEAFAHGGKLGVNLFVLISGYFLVNSKFKTEKALRLIFDTTLYGVAVLLGFAFANRELLLTDIITYCFPLLHKVWWFLTIYFVIYLLSGFINRFIKAINRRGLLALILILLVFTAVIPFLPKYFRVEIVTSDIMWFFIMYLTGAYIRVYEVGSKKTHGILVALGIYLVSFGLSILFSWLSESDPDLLFYSTAFYRMDSLFMYFTAIFLLIGFKFVNIKNSKVINTVAASTFGVYMLHDNHLMRRFLWIEFLKGAGYAESRYLFVHALVSVAIVFVGCSLLSILYNFTIGKGVAWLSKKLGGAIENSKPYKYFTSEAPKKAAPASPDDAPVPPDEVREPERDGRLEDGPQAQCPDDTKKENDSQV